MTFKHALFFTAALTLAGALSACGQAKDATKAVTDTAAATIDATVETTQDIVQSGQEMIKSGFDDAKLTAVLTSQPATAKARYDFRHPKATLEFFGIEPGMSVVEALPGGGWYSKILLPYLGENGSLVGADYALDMWPNFGGFATPEFIEKKKTWPTEWTTQATEWRGETGPKISAFAFGDRDSALDGTADAALFIRALHNLNRFTEVDNYMGEALADMHALLKDGGMLGVVQHRAPEANSAEASTGSNGYLKQSELIKTIEAAGFTFVESSEINANSKDIPSNSDIVWRLPPSLSTSRDDEVLKGQMIAIGESDRMTLKFIKG